VHRVDPRIKIIAMTAAVMIIVTTPPGACLSFCAYTLTVLCLLLLSRVPLAFAGTRLLLTMPFILVIGAFIPFVKEGEVAGSYSLGAWRLTLTYGGLALFWNILIKSSLSVLCMVILPATTRFDRLLRGLELLRCPRLIVMLLSFMYRYLFLLSDDLMRMLRARSARDCGGGPWLTVKTLARMLGVLFIRTYERAERVYLAMCSRGFDGTIVARGAMAIRRADIFFLVAVMTCFGAARGVGGA
jgi:cobalt/nickel transport system permease protein